MQGCLELMCYALTESLDRRFDKAKQAIGAALIDAKGLPQEYRPDFRAALCYCTLLIQSRESSASVTSEMRASARHLLSKVEACNSDELFQQLMFLVLRELGEYRLAIPFGERRLAIAVDKGESDSIGECLWKIGSCYSELGLRDHAAIAYRASVRIFRNQAGDPRLPVVLLALGNAVRKSAPSEAEALYKEAAALWEKKGQLASATPAWTNLAIVCGDQQRFDEAIDYYERVRRVRESSPATPPVQIARLYNNLASRYRKMGQFSRAREAVERALGILDKPGALGPKDGNSLAACLGTKGMIFRDEGRHTESLEWFRRARAEFEKQPNPNLENVIEELEHEADALRHLGKTDEACIVERRIESLRNDAAQVPSFEHHADSPAKLPDGALLIECEGGLRNASRYASIVAAGSRIREILQEANLGDWQGLLRIPECAILTCYGSNAQAMFDAVAPTLRSDSLFEGSLVTIRQGTEQRELVLTRRIVN